MTMKTVKDVLQSFDLPPTDGGRFDFLMDLAAHGVISRKLVIELCSIPHAELNKLIEEYGSYESPNS